LRFLLYVVFNNQFGSLFRAVLLDPPHGYPLYSSSEKEYLANFKKENDNG